MIWSNCFMWFCTFLILYFLNVGKDDKVGTCYSTHFRELPWADIFCVLLTWQKTFLVTNMYFFEINHNIPYDKSVNAMGTNAYKPFANKKMNPINFYYSSIIGQCKEMSNHGSAKSCPDLNKLKIWTKYYVREI